MGKRFLNGEPALWAFCYLPSYGIQIDEIQIVENSVAEDNSFPDETEGVPISGIESGVIDDNSFSDESISDFILMDNDDLIVLTSKLTRAEANDGFLRYLTSIYFFNSKLEKFYQAQAKEGYGMPRKIGNKYFIVAYSGLDPFFLFPLKNVKSNLITVDSQGKEKKLLELDNKIIGDIVEGTDSIILRITENTLTSQGEQTSRTTRDKLVKLFSDGTQKIVFGDDKNVRIGPLLNFNGSFLFSANENDVKSLDIMLDSDFNANETSSLNLLSKNGDVTEIIPFEKFLIAKFLINDKKVFSEIFTCDQGTLASCKESLIKIDPFETFPANITPIEAFSKADGMSGILYANTNNIFFSKTVNSENGQKKIALYKSDLAGSNDSLQTIYARGFTKDEVYTRIKSLTVMDNDDVHLILDRVKLQPKMKNNTQFPHYKKFNELIYIGSNSVPKLLSKRKGMSEFFEDSNEALIATKNSILVFNPRKNNGQFSEISKAKNGYLIDHRITANKEGNKIYYLTCPPIDLTDSVGVTKSEYRGPYVPYCPGAKSVFRISL